MLRIAMVTMRLRKERGFLLRIKQKGAEIARDMLFIELPLECLGFLSPGIKATFALLRSRVR